MTLIPAAGGSQSFLPAAGGSQSFLPAAGGSQSFLHDQTRHEEDPIDRAPRDSMPGQTVPAEQRVARPAPARPPTGFPQPSRGSVVAEAGATLGIALSGISRNKARTTLTLLGMIIGVASVITAVGIGTGQAAQVNAQISSLGTNLVTVQPGASFSGGVRGGAGSANTLTQSDVNALAAQVGPGEGVVAATFQPALEHRDRAAWRGVPFSAWLHRACSAMQRCRAAEGDGDA